MSLQDESFPTDELFDKLNKTSSFCRQNNVCLKDDEPDTYERCRASPFLNSDCSEKTCASDPIGLQHDNEAKQDLAITGGSNESHHHAHTNMQLGSGRSSKAVSYQDIHSAYTKRRYRHVTSKVSKYIADLQGQEEKRRNSSSSFQRHRSMPESLVPRGDGVGGGDDDDDEEHKKMDVSLSLANSSGTDTHARDENYERLFNEKEGLQSYSDHLQALLYKKIDENKLLRDNFEAIRTELSNCKEAMQRKTALSGVPLKLDGAAVGGSMSHSLHSLMYCPLMSGALVTKATQTDLPSLASELDDLYDLADAKPHPAANINDITYDSSAGSIEISLLSVPPAARQIPPSKLAKNNGNMKPLSLNFSTDSANAIAERDAGALSSSNRVATNNSGSSHPSSNDSAIEIEGHELLRSPQPQRRYLGQTTNFASTQDWCASEGIIYFDKRTNRITRLVALQQPVPSNVDISFVTQQSNMLQCTATSRSNRRKSSSLTSRMLRILGPCARCEDPNQTLDATYTVGVPLLGDDSNRSHNLR